jgi:two-component system LytT family response regulator
MILGVRPVAVLCAAAQAACRAELRELIEATPGFSVVREVSSTTELIAAVDAVRPDLVLMELQLPRIGGLRAAAVIAEGRRRMLIVLTSARASEPPPFDPHGGEVVLVPTEELCSRTLLDLWHSRRAR